MSISINLDKAKTIGHELRRAARAEEFKPFDEAIAKQIPNTDITTIEAKRQSIRNKYAEIQTVIDSAVSVIEIKAALS